MLICLNCKKNYYGEEPENERSHRMTKQRREEQLGRRKEPSTATERGPARIKSDYGERERERIGTIDNNRMMHEQREERRFCK